MIKIKVIIKNFVNDEHRNTSYKFLPSIIGVGKLFTI